MRDTWSFVRTLVRPREGRPGPSFEALVNPHLERLYRLAYRFTGSPDDAEDLVQALLVKLIQQEERVAAVDQLGPWLARALYYLFVDQVRHKGSSALDQADPEGEAVLEQLSAELADGPEERIEQLLTRSRIAAALARLPEEQRALVAWHDIEGYTLEELAEQQQVPLGTLKSRLHRARARLRVILMQPLGSIERVRR